MAFVETVVSQFVFDYLWKAGPGFRRQTTVIGPASAVAVPRSLFYWSGKRQIRNVSPFSSFPHHTFTVDQIVEIGGAILGAVVGKQAG